MPRYPTNALLVFLAGALAACQPNPDPAQAGFFSGIGNLTSGTYERRAAEQRAQLLGLQQQNLALQQAGSAEQAERSRLSAERDAMQRRRVALDSDLAAMRRDLEAARGGQAADQERLRQLSAQLAALEQASARLTASHAEGARLAEQIAEAEARRTRLRAVMNQALSLQQPRPQPPGS
jgi:chromosome segregation ATPase